MGGESNRDLLNECAEMQPLELLEMFAKISIPQQSLTAIHDFIVFGIENVSAHLNFTL